MAEKTQNTREVKVVDHIYQMQNLKSFVKIKNDWFPIGKFHLSFVSHEGKPGYKQVASIEAALKFHGADGALFLAKAITSGALKKLILLSKEKAARDKQQYPDNVFTSMGGTAAKNAKNGVCMFRSISLAPAQNGDCVMTVLSCEGVEDKDKGTIQPKKGADVQKTYIRVVFKFEDLFNMAAAIEAEYNAYRTALMLGGNISLSYHQQQNAQENGESEVAPGSPAQGNSVPVIQNEAPSTLPLPDKIVMIYSTCFAVNGSKPIAVKLEQAKDKLREVFNLLLTDDCGEMKSNKEEAVAVAEAIDKAIEGTKFAPQTFSISCTGKTDPEKTCEVVVILDYLY